MRKAVTAIVAAAAALAISAIAAPKSAQAGCWGCWMVVPGTSHAFVYGSIYGPHFAYPAYSEYGYGYDGYAPAYYGGHYGPYLFAHHDHRIAHRYW
jgi:hypothetical protein